VQRERRAEFNLQLAVDGQRYIEIFFRGPDQCVPIVFVIEESECSRQRQRQQQAY